MSKQQIVLDIHEKPSIVQWLPFSLQHLFAMFGATILVPLLVGISPAVALISSGVGTLAFIAITKGKVPAYLGSSFAFIAPLATVIHAEGVGQAMFGAMFAGILYGVVSLFIFKSGIQWIRRILPPVVIGPVIVVIGLGLAGTAAEMAVVQEVERVVELEAVDGTMVQLAESVKEFNNIYFLVSMLTLMITIISAIFLKGFFGLIPVLIGIIGGYIISYFLGLVDFNTVLTAPWFAIPEFVTPQVSWTAVLVIMPVAMVTLAEHLGDMLVISKVTGRNMLENPGLHRTVLGDGIASLLASLMGGPPNTTYGENVGVLAISRVFSIFVIGGAAVLAIVFGFIGKVSALIQSIPTPVMGGVSILLFGIIASSGLRVLIESEVQLTHKRNLIITSIILLAGIGSSILQGQGVINVSGMAIAALAGILLHLILPDEKVSYGSKPMFE